MAKLSFLLSTSCAASLLSASARSQVGMSKNMLKVQQLTSGYIIRSIERYINIYIYIYMIYVYICSNNNNNNDNNNKKKNKNKNNNNNNDDNNRSIIYNDPYSETNTSNRGTRHRVPTSRSSTASDARLRRLRSMLRSSGASGRPRAWNKICDQMCYL